MTTTVRVLVEGNKACEVSVQGNGADTTPSIVKPGEFATKQIHSEQRLVVQEIGEF